MAQIRKLEAEIVLASSGDLFYESFSNSPHALLNLQPDVFQGCDLLEGEYGKPGFLVQWTYTLEGKTYAGKQRFETIDKENKIMKLVAIEGNVMDAYKSFEVTIRVLTKEKGTNIVKWCIIYEKVHDGVADPHDHMEACVQATKKIDMQLSSH